MKKVDYERLQTEYDNLYLSWCETGDENQKLKEALRAIIEAWNEEDDIVINTGRKIREAEVLLNNEQSAQASVASKADSSNADDNQIPLKQQANETTL
jgi:hypothetical protein